MPAHMGLGDLVKVPLAFLALNLGTGRQARRARQNGIVSPGAIWGAFTGRRARREHAVQDYAAWRSWMDRYDPQDPTNQVAPPANAVPAAEWTLYLDHGTQFDAIMRGLFQHNPGITVTFITHKSNLNRLKRIEARNPGGQVNILWSDA